MAESTAGLAIDPSQGAKRRGKPSDARWAILAFLLAVTVINFIDRQTLSVLAPKIREMLHLSHEAYGRIVASFQFGMMSGEFPVGWLMDRWGVRLGLGLAVFWWSIATALHAFARSGLQFGLLRYWMGTGECGNFSGGVKTVNEWFPRAERALAIGIFNSGSMIGAIVAPPLVVFLATRYGYRWAFLAPAIFGACWVPLWWKLYGSASKQRPLTHGPGQTQVGSSWALLRHRQSWSVMACRFLVGPVAQFYWYWMPDYLYTVRGLSLRDIGILSWIPFLLGDVGSISGGWVAGLLLKRRFSLKNARQITMYAGAILCLGSFAVSFAPTAAHALAVIGVVMFGHTFLSANMFASVTDMFPDQEVGRATGLHGICGGLSGFLFPLLTGFLVDHFSYAPVFALAAIMPLAGVIALFVISRGLRPVGGGAEAQKELDWITMKLFWFIPTQGDGRYLGTTHLMRQTDHDYLKQIAQAVDQLGYEGVLLPTGNSCEDAWVVASTLVPVTERLKFLVAVRPAVMSPTLSARMAATFDRFSNSRLLINVVTGGDPEEAKGDGIFLSHDERYEVTDEFLTVWRSAISGRPTTFKGKHIHVEGAKVVYPPLRVPHPPLYLGGSSPAAIELAARQVDVYLTWGEPPALVAEKIEAVKRKAAEAGRALRFGIRLHVIVRETKEEAWQAANELIKYVDEDTIARSQKALARLDSEGQRRMVALHQGDRANLEISPNLWAGVGLVRGGAGTALVGDPETVAKRMLEYADIGIETFILSGYPHLEESYRTAELLFPLLPLSDEDSSDSGAVKSRHTASEVVGNEFRVVK